MKFQPDYHQLIDAAYNRASSRLPLYEHLIDDPLMTAILETKLHHLFVQDKAAYFRKH